jgi:adhesin/invasin
VVAPLSDQKDIENTIFTQVSAFYTDNRTTLNAGLGYRRLVSDNTLMLGVNAFYDHEFPYDHGRYSIGLEARSTVGEVNANMYQATTKWKTGKNGQQERALDGWDIEAGLPLPYMNWATVFVKRYEWDGVDGGKDAKGNDAQLRAYVPILPGLEIQAGRTFKDDEKDSNYFTAIFNVTEAFSNKPKQQVQWFNDTAYKLESMEDRRYEKVRRENIIVKQGNFYCRYENDAEGLDNTYAWLVDANGNASTNQNYSETAGDVKYLIGIAKFNEPQSSE